MTLPGQVPSANIAYKPRKLIKQGTPTNYQHVHVMHVYILPPCDEMMARNSNYPYKTGMHGWCRLRLLICIPGRFSLSVRVRARSLNVDSCADKSLAGL